MTNDIALGSVYLLMAMMLVLGSLIGRREPIAKLAKYALAWVVIFGAGFVLFTFRDDLSYVGQRLKTEALGSPMVEGEAVKVPQAIDGHYWVDAKVNGVPVRFLVDSGATVTTISRSVAKSAGVTVSANRNQVVQTGNGIIRVAQGSVDRLDVAGIERRDLSVHVADDDLNVIGMNFLSSLNRWGVEGRWLVLNP